MAKHPKTEDAAGSHQAQTLFRNLLSLTLFSNVQGLRSSSKQRMTSICSHPLVSLEHEEMSIFGVLRESWGSMASSGDFFFLVVKF